MSKDMKMKIQIDGDNKGFKNTLRQTGRDIDQFQQKQSNGIGMSELVASQVLGGKLGSSLGNLRNSAMSSAFRPSLDKIQKGRTKRNNLAEASRISERAGNSSQARVFRDMAMIQSRKNEKSMFRAQRNQKLIQGAGAGATYGFAALKGAGAAAAIAAAAGAALYKMSSFGRQQSKAAGQFSATATMAQAMKDQRDIQRQIEIANNPMHMDQQKRLVLSQERAEQAGAVGLGYVGTEGQILFNDLIAGLKGLAAAVTGADDITANGVAY